MIMRGCLAVTLGILIIISSAVAGSAPSFQLKNLSGEMVKLEDFAGKIVILDFWATYCKPCRREIPELEKVWKEFKDRGVVFITVNTDTSSSNSAVRSFVKQYDYNFPVLLDENSSVLEKYNADRTVPVTAIIDAKGNLHDKHLSYKPGDEAIYKKEIEELLKETAKPPAEGGGK